MSTDYAPLLKSALLEIRDLKTRLAAARQQEHAPIVIAGMACRFPGGAHDPEKFWELLRDGRDAIVDIPAERWDVDRWYDPDPNARGRMYTRKGGFLRDPIDGFDAGFFRISRREAEQMDPQQRLLLEVAWEALEDAGLSADALLGSRTGVFVGISGAEYGHLHLQAPDHHEIDSYSGTGVVLSVAAGRIAYVLGLRGPTLAVDTACSSSLVALHLAAQSLRAGECDFALAGGVNLILSPEGMVSLSRSHALSKAGRCATFDADADGYVRGEGCGMVVLTRASKAAPRIRAVLKGSAVNHDGRSSGLSVPNGPAQEEVLRQALAAADLRANDIGYVEAHGTGTALGDPIEVGALTRVLARERDATNPVRLGSLKTNIGHLEAAAGIAGVIKAVLALEQEAIPPHLHLNTPSPKIDWSDSVRIPTSLTAWPRGETSRRAGVSAFGFSGTNAHVVIEEAPAAVPLPALLVPHLIAVTARTDEALRSAAASLALHLETHPAIRAADVGATTTAGRARFARRATVVVRDTRVAAEALRAVASGQTHPCAEEAHVLKPGRVAFLFTGQGAQYPGMAAELARTEPVFATALDRYARVLDPLLAHPLAHLLSEASPDTLTQTSLAQPALLAVELALLELWRSWGLVPEAVLGHSVGEYAAAVAAGVMGSDDALRLVVDRGRLMQNAPGAGTMAAVFATEAEVRTAAPDIGIAALNGPRETVISGSLTEIDRALDHCAAAGLRTQRLQVSHAFHSRLMRSVVSEFEGVMQRVTLRAPERRFVTHAGAAGGAEIATSSYWTRSLCEPVRFAQGIKTLIDEGYNTFVEIGPAAALTALGRRIAPAAAFIPSLQKGRDDSESVVRAQAALLRNGVELDWETIAVARGGMRVSLPSYPFERTPHWLRESGPEVGTLSGKRVRTLHPGVLVQARWGARETPELNDHRIFDAIVCPGAAHLTLAIGAAMHRQEGPIALSDVRFETPLVLDGSASRTLQAVIHEDQTVLVASVGDEGDAWTSHARARVDSSVSPAGPVDIESMKAALPHVEDGATFYLPIDASGVITLGPAFRWISQVWRGDNVALVALRKPLEGEWPAIGWPAGVIDAAFQALNAVVPPANSNGDAYVPVALRRLWLDPARRPAFVLARLDGEVRQEGFEGTLELLDAEGARVGGIDRLSIARAPRARLLGNAGSPRFDLEWRPSGRGNPRPLTGTWVLVGGSVIATRLEGLMREAGAEVSCVTDIGAAPKGASVVSLAALDPDVAPLNLAERTWKVLQAGGHRTYLATRGAQPVRGSSDVVSPEGAVVNALGRVMALEMPSAWGGCVDVDPGADVETAARQILSLLAEDGDDECAFREGVRFVPRLVEAKSPPLAEFAGTGAWLVTGGLGAVGLAIAERLLLRGVPHVALLSRNPPGSETRDLLEKYGARVSVHQGDVTSSSDLSRVLDAVGPQLVGVVHAAGVLDDGAFLTQSWSRAAKVMAPKVEGALLLDALTASRPLQAFVLISSMVGVIGAPGQAAYAAANAFLLALAHARRAAGHPALAMAYGAWAGAGMAAKLEGVPKLGAHEAVDAFETALAQGRTTAMVARFDATRGSGSTRPLFSEIARPRTAIRHEDLRPRLNAADPDERPAILNAHLRTTVAKILGSIDVLDPSRPLAEMGFDSLMAVELRTALAASLGLDLPVTVLFDYPTLDGLAAHLLSHLSPKGEASPAPPPATLTNSDVLELSEEEAEARLLARLASLQGRS